MVIRLASPGATREVVREADESYRTIAGDSKHDAAEALSHWLHRAGVQPAQAARRSILRRTSTMQLEFPE